MRILNLTEFRALPAGTVFMKYTPCIFDDLSVKGGVLESDFFYENITCELDCTGSDDRTDKLFSAAETGESLLMDFDCCSRDGCFDDDQLFAVYDRRDVEMLIDKLGRCLESGYGR